MSLWIIPATLTVIAWGLWAFISKITVMHVSPMSGLIYQILGTAIVGIAVCAALAFDLESDPLGIGASVLTGALNMAGTLFFLKAIQHGKVGVIFVFINILYPMVAIALAFLFLGERLGLKEGLGIGFALFAVYLLSSDDGGETKHPEQEMVEAS